MIIMIILIDLFPNGAFHGQCKQIESKHCNYKKRVSKSHPAVNIPVDYKYSAPKE